MPNLTRTQLRGCSTVHHLAKAQSRPLLWLHFDTGKPDRFAVIVDTIEGEMAITDGVHFWCGTVLALDEERLLLIRDECCREFRRDAVSLLHLLPAVDFTT